MNYSTKQLSVIYKAMIYDVLLKYDLYLLITNKVICMLFSFVLEPINQVVIAF